MSRRLAALATIALVSPVVAQKAIAAPPPSPEPRPSPVAVVVDTSGSMSESDGSPSGRIKIDGAKVALLDFLEQVEPETPIGLRNYPAEGEATETEEGCSEGKAQFPVESRNPAEMAAKIRTLRAGGDTPTAAALEAAATELGKASSSGGTIVLVSDGESNCGRDPCDAARGIAESGVDLQTITVGFRISGAGAKELQCIADQTGGKYLSVHDNEGLAEAFDEISRPKIHLRVDYPPRVTAQVGSDPSGLVRIEATVTNTGQRLARGAVARIGFDVAAGAPAVIRPVVYLGNLAPGGSRKVAWVFRPSVPPADRNPMPLPFTVIAGAQNTLADAEFEAKIRVWDVYGDAGDAGPILASRSKIAIVGDSYSSGEGADVYLPGTDTDANPCHRSLYTYLAKAFDLQVKSIVACSGAVTNDIPNGQDKRTVGPQDDQLESLRRSDGVEAVVLTIGGNDAGFGDVAASCVIGRSSCARYVYADPIRQIRRQPSDLFVQEHLGKLPRALRTAYRAVNAVVNGPTARSASGPVPILVLGYPLPTPLTPRSCPGMYEQLAPGEIDFLNVLGLELNGKIDGTVSNLREEEGVPIFYVPNTEMAFQPDHTLCDFEPYARNIRSFNDVGREPELDDLGSDPSFWRRLAGLNPIRVVKRKIGASKAAYRRFMRRIQELFHPNQAGYAALSRAVLRWSQSPDAAVALRFLEGAPVADPPQPVTIDVSGPEDLGQLAPGTTPILQGGTAYPLNLQGFAADSPVAIGMRSDFRVLADTTADAAGAISAQIGIPSDVEPGDHMLIVSGTGDDGRPRTVEIPFWIAGGGPPAAVLALIWGGAVGAAVTLILALALAVATRRRNRLPEGTSR